MRKILLLLLFPFAMFAQEPYHGVPPAAATWLSTNGTLAGPWNPLTGAAGTDPYIGTPRAAGLYYSSTGTQAGPWYPCTLAICFGGGGSTLSLTSPTSTLTLSPSPITGTGTLDLNLAHANTWTGQQTFVAPALGTPASGVLTNATGLPAASVLAGALANGMTATTQTTGDSTTKVATDAFVLANGGSSVWSSLTNPTGNLSLNLGTNLTTFTGGLNFAGPFEQQNTWTVGTIDTSSIFQNFRVPYGWTAGTVFPSIGNEFSMAVPSGGTSQFEADAVGIYQTCGNVSTDCVALSTTAVRGVTNANPFGANFNVWDNNLAGPNLFALELDAVAQNAGTSGELLRMDPWIGSLANPFYGIHLFRDTHGQVGLTTLIESDNLASVNFADIGESSTVSGTSQRTNWGNGSTSYAEFVDAGGLLNFNGGLKIGSSGQLTVAKATGYLTLSGCAGGSFLAADGTGCATPSGSGTVNSGSGYALPAYASGSGTAVSPSNVKTDATGNVLLAPGIVDGLAPVTVTTGSSATLGGTYKSGYTFNQNATAATAITYTLPTAAAGLQYCVGNSWNGSAATTGTLELLTSASGQFIIFTDGTLSATGGYVISAGAAADFACVVGVDSTHWFFKPSSGTWSKH